MTSSTALQIDKGGEAEEALREYFRELGSFVIRGVPVREMRENVTDIDLWVYSRISPHARHISIIDIKNKKRAKGFERAIWVRGLQAAVGAQESIIATTGQRESIVPFANRLGVKVLAPDTMRAILSKYGRRPGRLSNEEIFSRWKILQIRGAETVKTRIESALAELPHGISFRALNGWIDDAAILFSLSLDRERRPADFMRAALFCSALVALGADYLGRDQSFSEPSVRAERFRQGLLFGRVDSGVSGSYIDFAERIVTECLDPTGAAAATIRIGFEKSLSTLPINGLVDFFSRPASGKELIDGAIALEASVFSSIELEMSALKSEARTIIGLILDYARLPRSEILGISSANAPSKNKATSIPQSGDEQDDLPLAASDPKSGTN